MVDKDYSYTYGPIIVVSGKQEQLNTLKIINNPFTSNIGMIISSDKKQMFQLILTDIGGRNIVTKNELCVRGTNYFFFENLERLFPGVYVIQVISNDNVFKEKLIKLK